MQNLFETIANKAGEFGVQKFSEVDNFKDNPWFHSGVPELDYNLGTLGFPKGMIEISGKSRSGKTTLGLAGMKHFLLTHSEDGIALILSSEYRDNKYYSEKIGVDTNRVLIYQILFVEDMFLTLSNFIQLVNDEFAKEKRKPKFYFLWDSIGATISKSEIEATEENMKKMEKLAKEGKREELNGLKLKAEKMGAFPKESKKFAKFIVSKVYSNAITMVMINHIYDSMNGMGGQKSFGGSWIEYMPTIRLRMKLLKSIQLDDITVAQLSDITVIKNDFGSRRTTTAEILLGKGFVLSEKEIAFAVDQGIVEKKGARKHSFMNDKLVWSTPRELYKLYEDDNKLLKILHKKVVEAYHNKVKKERGLI